MIDESFFFSINKTKYFYFTSIRLKNKKRQKFPFFKIRPNGSQKLELAATGKFGLFLKSACRIYLEKGLNILTNKKCVG